MSPPISGTTAASTQRCSIQSCGWQARSSRISARPSTCRVLPIRTSSPAPSRSSIARKEARPVTVNPTQPAAHCHPELTEGPQPLTGFHHMTMMCSDARENLRFYTEVLGLRFVKKTVNFDDPFVYHLYYGDYEGTPGTILTFFEWPRAVKGHPGIG